MKTLKINLFYECTSECKHCRFSCKKSIADNPPDIKTPLYVAKKLKEHFGLDYAVILGGEPSLYPNEVHNLLRDLNSLGIRTRVETNASFARNIESARAFLSPLVNTETQVMLSLDAFHIEYIPAVCVENATKVCKELGLVFNLEVPFLDIEKRDNETDRKTQALLDDFKSKFEAPIYEGQIVFTGRAASTFGDEFSKGKGIPTEKCTCVPWWFDGKIDSTDLIIYEPGGYITKGCGIAIGNVNKTDIITLLDNFNIENHPIFNILAEEGPLGLAHMAEKFGYTIKENYADKCHLCYEARQFLKGSYSEVLMPEQHYLYEAI